MFFHNAVNLLHGAAGCADTRNKNDIQTEIVFKTRHKEAISLPYNTSCSGTGMGFAYFRSCGYANAVFAELVL